MSISSYVPLVPDIETFKEQFERVTTDVMTLVTSLTDEQFAWRPAPDGWSVEQCIEHLNATARVFLPELDRGIATAIEKNLYSDGPYTYNWIGRLFVRAIAPPVRVRFRAASDVAPQAGRTRKEIMAGFRAFQVQYVDRLRQANGLNLAKARVRSPAAMWLRVPLGSGFAVILAHERRHVWQARRVTEAGGFPRGSGS